GSVGLIASIDCTTIDSLLGGNSLPGGAGRPTQVSVLSNGSCAIVMFTRLPLPSTSAMRRHVPSRERLSRTRDVRANQLFTASGSPACSAVLAASAEVSSAADAASHLK